MLEWTVIKCETLFLREKDYQNQGMSTTNCKFILLVATISFTYDMLGLKDTQLQGFTVKIDWPRISLFSP